MSSCGAYKCDINVGDRSTIKTVVHIYLTNLVAWLSRLSDTDDAYLSHKHMWH